MIFLMNYINNKREYNSERRRKHALLKLSESLLEHKREYNSERRRKLDALVYEGKNGGINKREYNSERRRKHKLACALSF